MVRFGVLFASVVLAAGAATGQEAGSYAGNYYCQPDFAAGGRYDEQQKKWVGTGFKPGANFVLSIKYKSKENEGPPSNKTIYTYNIAITEAGANQESFCSRPGVERNPFDPEATDVKVYDGKFVQCTWVTDDFKFNHENLRFLDIYPIGFIDGDSNANNPAVVGGTCTKIPQ